MKNEINLSKKRILFCNVAYMEHYDNDLFSGDIPLNGGAFVDENKDAFEKYNFHLYPDQKCRGFVETGNIKTQNNELINRKINIQNIDELYKKEDSINGVTVVFCAISKREKATVIVGWYNNATVYRERRKYNEDSDRLYNIETFAENAVLLKESKRTKKVPRARTAGIGFGRSNLWYAKGECAQQYVDDVLNYINLYNQKI